MVHWGMCRFRITLKKDSKMSSKELPNAEEPAGVFQMLGKKSIFYFESDSAPVPSPSQLDFSGKSRISTSIADSLLPLRKRQSMPALTVVGSGHMSSLDLHKEAAPSTVPSADDLHIPTAIMSHAHFESRAPAQRETQGYIPDHYQTGPQYGSNQILKSFCREIDVFGHQHQRFAESSKPGAEKSLSCPPSPRHESSPDFTKMFQVSKISSEAVVRHSKSNSDLHRLSQVQEVPGEQELGQSLAVAKPSEVDHKAEPQRAVPTHGLLTKEKPFLVADSVDGKKLPITRKVIDWFTTPQPQTRKLKKNELNAMAPTSF